MKPALSTLLLKGKIRVRAQGRPASNGRQLHPLPLWVIRSHYPGEGLAGRQKSCRPEDAGAETVQANSRGPKEASTHGLSVRRFGGYKSALPGSLPHCERRDSGARPTARARGPGSFHRAESPAAARAWGAAGAESIPPGTGAAPALARALGPVPPSPPPGRRGTWNREAPGSPGSAKPLFGPGHQVNIR